VVHLKGFSPYIYWPIECIPKPLFMGVFKVAKIAYIYWPIECTTKLSFLGVFEVVRITYIYWPIECTSKKYLHDYSRLQEFPTSIGKLNGFQNFRLSMYSSL
jgi:hypothetical protein